MNNTFSNNNFLVTGTMRSGTNLLCNILGVHPDILVHSEALHFFRFFYGLYDPLSKQNTHRLLREQHARLFYRFGINFDVDKVLKLIGSDFHYAAIYNAICSNLLSGSRNSLYGDGSPLSWNYIPEYINLFPGLKVIHIYRDPRAVFSSWQKITYDKSGSWNAVFNCISSMDAINNYKRMFSNNFYHVVSYENLIREPYNEILRLCDFLNISFDPIMLKPDQWGHILNKKNCRTSNNFSSSKTTDLKIFNKSRINSWKLNLPKWQISLCEYFTYKQMRKFKLEPYAGRLDPANAKFLINSLSLNSWTKKALSNWIETGTGIQGHSSNPRDPYNWGALPPGTRFVNTEEGKSYLKTLNDINDYEVSELHER